jgi:cytoskeletal protein RodZ
MLANYATFLDLDTEALLLRFADGLQARRHEKYAETPREKIQTEVVASIPLWRNFLAGDLIFGVVMIAILFALAIWGVGRVVSSQSTDASRVEPTAPSVAEALADVPLPTPSLDATFVPVDENVTATPDLGTAEPQTFNANVTVDIFAVERTFMRVSVDGEQVFEGRMAPGESKVFEGNTEVLVLTGNASALRVTYNGRDLGLMGTEGEVVSRVYLVSGVATPTATISPTPTNTLPVTDTPTETPTPTMTPEATVAP